MFSHTVPKKLLKQFAYDDPCTKSKRLWQYQKGLPPWRKASPQRATAWDGHFADPANAAKEAELELRLKQDFEDPVNEFIESIDAAFTWNPEKVRLLTGYITILFNRSRARRAASAENARIKIEALQSLYGNEDRLAQVAHQRTKELIERGVWLTRPVTKRDVRESIKQQIAEHSRPDEAQRDYIQALETMMNFRDEAMRNGHWEIITTDAAHPFVIGDAPVVTMERTEGNLLYFAMGFARPNVEVFLPVSPTACIHAVPRVTRTREVQRPSVIEVNRAQAAFATKHCFGSINSPEIDAVLQPQFGSIRLGITGFNTRHIDYSQVLFDILMGRRPRAA